MCENDDCGIANNSTISGSDHADSILANLTNQVGDIKNQNMRIIFAVIGGIIFLLLAIVLIYRISGQCLIKRQQNNLEADQPPGYPESPPPYFIACQIYNSLRRGVTRSLRFSRRRGNSTPPPNYYDLPDIIATTTNTSHTIEQTLPNTSH